MIVALPLADLAFGSGIPALAVGHLAIGRDLCRDSQFPYRVAKADGYVLMRPHGWS